MRLSTVRYPRPAYYRLTDENISHIMRPSESVKVDVDIGASKDAPSKELRRENSTKQREG
ncbi:MAG: hypothetical protein ACK40X_03330 [Armatimonadota bacterium]